MDKLLDTKIIKGKKWEFHLRPTRNKNFIVAKQKSIYDRMIEVRVHTMYDGMLVALPDNPKDLIEGEVLATIKVFMLALQKIHC